MEDVVDGLIATVTEFIGTTSLGGGIADVITVNGGVKWGDPGLVTMYEYPYFYVEPLRNAPLSETMSKVGWDVRELNVQVCFVVNSADYFDESVSEVAATREVVQVGEALWKWLRRFSKLHLGDLTDVRNLNVQSVDYVPQDRNGIFTRMASVMVVVEKKYQHRD